MSESNTMEDALKLVTSFKEEKKRKKTQQFAAEVNEQRRKEMQQQRKMREEERKYLGDAAAGGDDDVDAIGGADDIESEMKALKKRRILSQLRQRGKLGHEKRDDDEFDENGGGGAGESGNAVLEEDDADEPPFKKKKGKRAAANDDDDDDDDDDDMFGDERSEDKEAVEEGATVAEVDGEHIVVRRNVAGEEDGEEFDDATTVVGGKVIGFEPFNLRDERARGYFTEDGAYVETGADGEEKVDDPWLNEVDARDDDDENDAVLDARDTAHRKQLEERAMMDAEPDAVVKEDAATVASRLMRELGDDETVNKAMWRLRPPKKASAEEKAAFEKFTDLVDRLMALGFHEVYSATRATIRKWIADQDKDDDDEVAVSGAAGDSTLYQYKVGDVADVHGPFPGTSMRQWAAGGYFAAGNTMVRTCTQSGEGVGEWKNANSVSF